MTAPDATGEASGDRHPVKLSPMRAAIARRMTQSKTTAPHFYVSTELEMDASLTALRTLNEGRPEGERVTVSAVLVRAVALTLREHPALNAVWGEAGLERVDPVHLGVAIALDEGLIAPAILDADRLDLAATSGALRDLAARARAGKLRAAEFSSPTFTLSNLGMWNVSAFTAIIPPPQVAILATGRAEPRAVVREGAVVVRSIVTATVSADHRAVDGAGVAAFLTGLAERVRTPEGWFDPS
jgi:pyruvate dehydrogenase E2 component (dihydrolipoamide acetyltransferase)